MVKRIYRRLQGYYLIKLIVYFLQIYEQHSLNFILYKIFFIAENVTVAPSAEEQETLVLIEKLESATSYYQIRSALYRHQVVKDKAWEPDREAEKTRIEELLPLQVKALNKALESNLIVDYYELETGSFQIFIEGEDRPVNISKSSIVSWLKEQERINSFTI
ncbi:hypothetical protein NIES4071_14080 [Calothrix sp. NIES-4071]|nr:hypothetical protein NIES4071_14080 [Calothrix sp. NIES-4071]BAZ55746.1 hypothetical protein NIES4105_14030 [Calothrix sp. NIES-4105]